MGDELYMEILAGTSTVKHRREVEAKPSIVFPYRMCRVDTVRANPFISLCRLCVSSSEVLRVLHRVSRDCEMHLGSKKSSPSTLLSILLKEI